MAAEEINYRRFFDINDLAAIRIEEPKVLEAVHEKAFQLLRDGKVTGLRIDHVDGLFDPRRYLEDLQRPRDGEQRPPRRPPPAAVYVVVEKILTGAEELPTEWPVHGTTGYELLNVVNGLFVDAPGLRLIERGYRRLREGSGTFDDLLYRAKKLILRTAMSSELHVLARRLDRISEQHRWSRDFTASSLHLALGEVIACFPVYRTYAQPDTLTIGDGDRLHVLRAVREAKRRNRATSESVFDFLCDLLLLRDPEGLSEADHADRRELVMRLQQLTGPVMAKGLEDTVFYRYYPLASLNEVGGRPTTGPTEIDRFHVFCARRDERWPHALSATATHDTKRGEDMRARLDVLSELPREWMEAVKRWQRMNRRAKPVVDEARVPGSNEEYLLYQTLLGVWPLEALDRELLGGGAPRPRGSGERLPGQGAPRGQAAHQLDQRQRAVREGLRAVSAPPPRPRTRPATPFLADCGGSCRRSRSLGSTTRWLRSSSRRPSPASRTSTRGPSCGTSRWSIPTTAARSTTPRAGPSSASSAALEGEALQGRIEAARARPADGALKLLVTMRALAHRRRHRELYERGAYLPLAVEGPGARHVVAFARVASDGRASITVVGRFFAARDGSAQPPVERDALGRDAPATAG